jgi:clan AA aspartic protease
MVGRVDHLRRALVPITLQGRYASSTVEAIVDTGFNGQLSVPDALMQRLGFLQYGIQQATFADGRSAVEKLYLVDVQWVGRPVRCIAGASQLPDCLIGTELLEGHTLTVDFGAAKSVEVR